MIQIFEKSVIIRALLIIAICIGAGITWFVKPDTIQDVLKVAGYTISATGIFIWMLNVSQCWRLIWYIIKPLNWWIFPDLNGDWETINYSNIKKHAEFRPELKQKKLNSKIAGRVTIRQNLFGISMTFHSKNGYTSSDTIFVKLERTSESQRFRLVYVFEGETAEAVDTDEQRHFGAGRIEIKWIEKLIQIEGVYWTNRNWRNALNTAGTIVMKRSK